MPMVLWTRLFTEAQGYDMKEHIVYQYNKSTIMISNYRNSPIGKRMKHINVRYFSRRYTGKEGYQPVIFPYIGHV